jgi:hypothetical protein
VVAKVAARDEDFQPTKGKVVADDADRFTLRENSY